MSHLNILIVDDEVVARKSMARLLAPYGECSLAATPGEALDAVQGAPEDDRPFELMCLDVHMPGMEGHELLGQIRKWEQSVNRSAPGAALKVILMSSQTQAQALPLALTEGLETFLNKPINASQLHQALRQLSLCD